MIGNIGQSEVLWSTPALAQPNDHLLVLLHGATSNEHDLFDRLVPVLRADLVVVSPRGPIAEDHGYSWVSPQARASAVTDAEVAALGNEIARSFLAWLDTLPAYRSVGLLGASQGACVALQLLRLAPARFAYAVNISGYALPGYEPGDARLQRARPNVFWGRGMHDHVIPLSYVDRTARWLPRHSTLTEGTYEAGHDVSEVELDDIAVFVNAQIPRPP